MTQKKIYIHYKLVPFESGNKHFKNPLKKILRVLILLFELWSRKEMSKIKHSEIFPQGSNKYIFVVLCFQTKWCHNLNVPLETRLFTMCHPAWIAIRRFWFIHNIKNFFKALKGLRFAKATLQSAFDFDDLTLLWCLYC